jgi:hypothetical protein
MAFSLAVAVAAATECQIKRSPRESQETQFHSVNFYTYAGENRETRNNRTSPTCDNNRRRCGRHATSERAARATYFRLNDKYHFKMRISAPEIVT